MGTRNVRGAAIAAALSLSLSACSGAPVSSLSEPDGFTPPNLAAALRRPDHVVLVSVARLTSDRYRASSSREPDMPTLAKLAAAGVAADAVSSVTPASTYPSHASLVTGRTAAAHGISADLQLGKVGIRGARNWHASTFSVPSVWNLAERAELRVAALAWPSTVGAPIPMLVTDVVPTRLGEKWLGVLSDSSTPEVLTLLERFGAGDAEADAEGAKRDSVLLQTACALLSSPVAPKLTLLRLSQTVSPVALHGSDSEEAREAFARADSGLAALLNCITRIGLIENAAVLVVGDHGVLPVHTVIAPNAALEREGLIQLDRRGGMAGWSAIARSNGGTAFVYAANESAALRARKVLAARGDSTRAFRVQSASEMLASGADRKAWFGLVAQPGFYFSDVARPPLLGAAALRAVGGYPPSLSEMDAGFVAWGRGLRTSVRIPRMRLTDVAPTLAHLLGVEFADSESADFDGRPLVGILRVPATRR